MITNSIVSRLSIQKLMKAPGNQYVIPVYQRNYVWSKKDQIKTFLDDFKSVIVDPNKQHFIGMIVDYEVAASSTTHLFYVIDGQQRLTTIFLLYYALLERAVSEGDTKMEGIFKRSLFDEDADEGYENKLRPLTVDDEVFKAIMSGNVSELSDSGKKNNVFLAYEFIKEYVNNQLGEFPLNSIYEALTRMDLIEFPLSAGDDSQQIFESINVKGKTLSPIDVIRNFVLMEIPEKKKDEFYLNNWLKVERSFEDENAFLSFFRQFLIAQTFEPVTMKNVYPIFKEWFAKELQDKDVQSVFSIIKDYVKAYRFLLFDDYSDIKNRLVRECLRDFRNIHSEMPRPFLLKMTILYLGGKLAEAEYAQIVFLINAFIERRSMLDWNTSGISRFMVMLLKYVEEDVATNGVLYLEATRYNVINRTANTAARMPTDKEIRDGLTTCNAYDRREALHVFFDRLESEGRDEVVKSTTGLPIEHLMPQNGSYWIENMGLSQEEYDYQRNRLGNLTLVTARSNSIMSNRPFDYKRDILIDSGHFRLNVPIAAEPTWDVGHIDKRTDSLIEKFLSLYPYSPSDRQFQATPSGRHPRQISYPTTDLTKEAVASWCAGRSSAGSELLKQFAEVLIERKGYLAKYRPDLIALIPADADLICADLVPMKSDLIVRVKLPDDISSCSLKSYVVPESNGWSLRWEVHVAAVDDFEEAIEILKDSANMVRAKRKKTNVAFDRVRFAEEIKRYISKNASLGVSMTTSNVSYLRFLSPMTRALSKDAGAGTWIEDNQLLAYEVANFSKGDVAFVWLLIGPGDQQIKQKIFDLMKNDPFFARYGRGASPQNWQGMVRFDIWTKDDDTGDEIKNEEIALNNFKRFLAEEFPKIESALLKLSKQLSE